MAAVRDLQIAKIRFKEAVINLSQKEAEYKKSNEKCITGQIKVELWRLELARAEAAIRFSSRRVQHEAVPALGALPVDIVVAIFSRIPVDERLRCEQVCRGWQQLLRQSSFWERIDLSSVKGRGERITDDILLDLSLRTWETTGRCEEMEAVLREWKKSGQARAFGKFGFQVKSLVVSGCTSLSVEMIMAVVRMSPDLQELVAVACKRFGTRNFVELHPDLFVVADAELLVPAPADLDIVTRLLRRSPPDFRYVCLHELCVIGRDLSLDEMSLLTSGLSENRSISTLRLTYCGLQDEHMILLEGALAENTLLSCLGLGGNDELGWQGFSALTQLLLSPTCYLKALCLDSCFMGNDNFGLLQVALKASRHLTQLNLAYNDLTEAAAPHLEELLATTSSLTDLDLGSNWLRTPGVTRLAKVLVNNTSLRKLDLKGNEMGVEGAINLANALRSNTALKTLHAHHCNNIGVNGALAFVEALRTNRILTSLKVEVRADNLQVGQVLMQALQCSPALDCLTLTLCGGEISEDLMLLLARSLRDWSPRLAVVRCCPRHSPDIHRGFPVGQLLGAEEIEVIARRARRSRTWQSMVASSQRHKLYLVLGMGVICGVALWYASRKGSRPPFLLPQLKLPEYLEQSHLRPYQATEYVQVE